MRQSRIRPDVNAGSMADIAFLLLIFFLVTAVIPNDQGFNRRLPKLCEDPPCMADIYERNLLKITINRKDELMIKEMIIPLQDLKSIVKEFIDNNGDGSCAYCYGIKLSTLSDNPSKAIISLQTHPQSSYDFFIQVQDELAQAYYELRALYAAKEFGKSIGDLSKDEINTLMDVYPFILSEALIN